MNISDINHLNNLICDTNVNIENLGLLNSNIPGTLSFIDSEKYIGDLVANRNIAAVFTTSEIAEILKDSTVFCLVDAKPRVRFFETLNLFNISYNAHNMKEPNDIHPSAIIKTEIPSNSSIVVGENSIINECVVINPGVVIGSNCEISSFVTLGGQGFEYKNDGNKILKVVHAGRVKIGDFVDIKEFTSVHKAVFSFDETTIGSYTKIDSHSHIGHGNKVGSNCIICSHSNISGNTVIEDKVYIGPGSNIPNRLVISNEAKVRVGSTVTKNVGAKEEVSGNFAIPHDIQIESVKKLVERANR